MTTAPVMSLRVAYTSEQEVRLQDPVTAEVITSFPLYRLGVVEDAFYKSFYVPRSFVGLWNTFGFIYDDDRVTLVSLQKNVVTHIASVSKLGWVQLFDDLKMIKNYTFDDGGSN